MGAHSLLNLLNELSKIDKKRALATNFVKMFLIGWRTLSQVLLRQKWRHTYRH